LFGVRQVKVVLALANPAVVPNGSWPIGVANEHVVGVRRALLLLKYYCGILVLVLGRRKGIKAHVRGQGWSRVSILVGEICEL
jgi:hypothetical protein